MSETLKPCPFCGGAPELSRDSSDFYHWIACPKCLAGGPPKVPGEDATEAWNRRAPSPHGQDVEGHKWCRYAGPGRGDCEHFVGLPSVEDETTCDEYGIPHGWCDYRWMCEKNRRLHEELHVLRSRQEPKPKE